jgi:putative tryptophan/tyrosine transport system substrate-binding protein
MNALGWREGLNLEIVHRFAGGEPLHLPTLARDLMASKPDVLLARSTLPVRALLGETRSMPIIFVSLSDPIGENFAATLARPGGNVTGFTNFEASMAGKWLELLKEVAPQSQRVGLLFAPSAATVGGARPFFMPQIVAAASAMRVRVENVPVNRVEEVEPTIRAFAGDRDCGLLVLPDVFTVGNRRAIIDTCTQQRIPAMFAFRNMVVEGGLMSYGVNVADLYRRAAEYVHRVLHGEHPRDLPIQAPTSFQLVLNQGAANALSLTIPPTLLARADEVIE